MSMENAVNEAETAKRSGFEVVKENSRWLRGTLAEELGQDTDHFSDDAKNLLKFHGSYQQEDRDARKNRAKTGVGKHYMCMIRLKLPGGVLSAKQYLALDELASQYGNNTLRITTRQSIQFHGVLKANLRNTIRGINDCLLTTLGGCGDVNRNVMACPAPIGDPVREELQVQANAIALHLAPRSNAYHDIWLNGEQMSPDADEAEGVEPIYGKVYLPRKFKIGLSMPYDNCVDLYAQDLGFLAIVENGRTVGYNMTVGGGMGRTHGNVNTFAQLGQSICFIEPKEVVGAAEAVIKFFRDHGNRADRKRARIKYVVHDWGVEKVREVLARDYFGRLIAPPKSVTISDVDLHHGWQKQANGKWFLGLSVENGRIKDHGPRQLRSGVRKIVETIGASVRLTGQQDLLLCDIDADSRPRVDAMLVQYGIPHPESLSMARRWSMACPAIPTCGLAISESERTLPGIIDALEPELQQLGFANERISLRMTGCPNGCARPYQSEIGIVGRSGEKYTVYLGGNTLGERLNTVFQDLVPREQIVPLLKKVLQQFKMERVGDETFGDYCHRVGNDKLCAIAGASPPKH